MSSSPDTPSIPAPPDAGSTDTDDPTDDDSEGADSGASGTVAQSGAEALGVRRTIYLAASVTVVMAAIVAALVLGRTYTTNDATLARDSDITTVARQVVANLVTLRHGSADADVQRIRDGATGEFLNQIGDTTGGVCRCTQAGAGRLDRRGRRGRDTVVERRDRHRDRCGDLTGQELRGA